MSDDFAAALLREKMAALRQLAYGATHELNNPLANIATRAQALLADEVAPDRRKKLAVIYAQAMRAHEMLADLTLFARPPRPQRRRQVCAELVAQATGELAERAREQQTEVRCGEIPGDLRFQADGVQFVVALKALIANALEALGSGGAIDITVAATAHEVIVRVADTGPGFSEEAGRHLFDPFYSGREAGRGLGFGLTKAWTIAEQHGGSLSGANNSPAPGATFELRFPLVEPTAESG